MIIYNNISFKYRRILFILVDRNCSTNIVSVITIDVTVLNPFCRELLNAFKGFNWCLCAENRSFWSLNRNAYTHCIFRTKNIILTQLWVIHHQIGCNVLILTKTHSAKVIWSMPSMYTTSCSKHQTRCA